MGARCVNVDGMLLRVADSFDDAEGSDDMLAAKELVAYMREQLAKRPPMPCTSTRCTHHETHDHGAECSTTCRCGRGERP